MTVWVTGAAGFIGSTLVERLAEGGETVVGIDAFTDYYDVEQKRSNWERLRTLSSVRLRELDLLQADLSGIDAPSMIFHLAGEPGVRPSWGKKFPMYLDRNVRLVEKIASFATDTGVPMVYASSSSVYGVLEGSAAARESGVTVPHSPYGISKLAGELIVRAYSANLGLRSASVRYFTVYGPRQRPDMAIHRLCRSALYGDEFVLNGDGSQIREFTFVGDVVEATICARDVVDVKSPVFNIAGGSTVSMRELMDVVREVSGRQLNVQVGGQALGDVLATRADLENTLHNLGWCAKVDLRSGVEAQLQWHGSFEAANA